MTPSESERTTERKWIDRGTLSTQALDVVLDLAGDHK